jgi:hypothetical protein
MVVGLGLDFIVVLVFVAIGRSVHTHGESATGLASTTWPFAVGLALAWLGAVALHRSPPSLKVGAAITGVTVAIGMVLRVIAGQGTAFAFIVVALAFLGAGMALWRLIRVVASHSRPRRSSA